ncbi:MAG TPA: DUF3325 domain-containing protein [Dongiaceae bacterium]|nr:DUF3325 domain-containing protein [Dongiaceae bacterium]
MADSSGMILVFAAIANVAGFAWLALAMNVHWQQIQGGPAPSHAQRIALRLLGITGLVGSAILCFLADRPSMAVLVWIMLLAGAAVLVALTLAWRPGLLRILWPLS